MRTGARVRRCEKTSAFAQRFLSSSAGGGSGFEFGLCAARQPKDLARLVPNSAEQGSGLATVIHWTALDAGQLKTGRESEFATRRGSSQSAPDCCAGTNFAAVPPNLKGRCAGSRLAAALGRLLSSAAAGWATASVKACATPALTRKRSRTLAASGQVLHKPRGRKPRRTPRWPLNAAAMAIGLRRRRDPAARDASSRPRAQVQRACGAPLRCRRGQQRGIRGRRSCSARSNPPDAAFGVELTSVHGARS
jgi:hypothetical protein